MSRHIVFIDSGDTIIDEASQVFSADGVVLKARCIPGADRMLRQLRAEGYRVAMVADGLAQSFRNVYNELGLNEYFEARIYSSDVGADKPSPKMFDAAFRELGLSPEDRGRVVMVGNNLERDIAGANAYGITSVLLDRSPRYRATPHSPAETPDYVIHSPLELSALLHRLDASLPEEKEQEPCPTVSLP